jgi:hypothetical protein
METAKVTTAGKTKRKRKKVICGSLEVMTNV